MNTNSFSTHQKQCRESIKRILMPSEPRNTHKTDSLVLGTNYLEGKFTLTTESLKTLCKTLIMLLTASESSLTIEKHFLPSKVN